MNTENLSSVYTNAYLVNGLLHQADNHLLDDFDKIKVNELSDEQIYDLLYKYRSLQELITPAYELNKQLIKKLEALN